MMFSLVSLQLFWDILFIIYILFIFKDILRISRLPGFEDI